MYLSTQDLEKRGWTKGLIKKLMPKPDDIEYFSRYGCQYFYGLLRVDKIEQTDEFKDLQEKALRRRASGKSSTERRKAEYLDYLKNQMPVRVRFISFDELLQNAINSYNVHRAYKSQFCDDDYQPAGTNSDPAFLERITVNYIRHNLTKYDDLLHSTHCKIGKEEALKIIQIRIFEAIADTYPDLRAECDKQLIRRGLFNEKSLNNPQTNLFN